MPPLYSDSYYTTLDAVVNQFNFRNLMSQSTPLLIAQVTDTHLFAEADKSLFGLPTAHSLQAILAQVQLLQPDLLLLTGDLSQDETATAYERLRDLVSPLSIPAYWLPGNHDNPEVVAKILDSPPISAQKSFTAGGWQFLLLNSQIPGQVGGYLSPESLDWLDSQLTSSSDKPTLIGLHHQPLAVDSAWIDGSKVANAEELLGILDNHPQVKLVIFGHIHQEFDCWRHNIRYLGTPSTGGQFKPRSPNFALDEIAPGFRWLKLYPDGKFETRVERLSWEVYQKLLNCGS